jgi:hypothetical protein
MEIMRAQPAGMSLKPRHLWYKVSRNTTPIARTGAGDRWGIFGIAKAIYSIVTASRPISLATSSKCAESQSRMASASRIRHSSSLIAGMSLGTIDGTGLIRSVWMSGIESPLGETGATERRRRMRLFGARLAARTGRRTPDGLPYRDSRVREKDSKSLPRGRPADRWHPGTAYLVLCKARRLCYTLPACEPQVSPIPR